MLMERIAALDPGREKCGFAVLREDGKVLMQRVIETARLEQEVRAAREEHGFCVLVEGELRVLKQDHLLDTLSAGDCFGEMALFAAGRGARTSSVETLTPARILTIRAPALLRASAVCQMHFYKGFLEVLATRLSVANSRIASV